MHQALRVPELQQQIFNSLLPAFDIESLTFAESYSFASYVPDKKTRSTLLNVALTCRALKETALDALWWAMDDLTPLFVLLRAYGKEYRGMKQARGPISAEECTKLFSYATRIKLFHFASRRELRPSLCMRVLMVSGRPYLLPSLKYFLVSTSTPELMFFPSATLRVLNISNEYFTDSDMVWNAYDIHALVDSLPHLAPQLIGLRLAYEMTEDCLRTLDSLPNLQYLEINNKLADEEEEEDLEVKVLDNEIICKVLSLQHVSRLKVKGSLEFVVNLPTSLSPKRALMNSRSIEFVSRYDTSIEGLTSFFQLVDLPLLECLEVYHFDLQVEEDLCAFLQSVLSATKQRSLRSLKLDFEDSTVQVPLARIPGLLRFHLTSLHINVLKPLSRKDISVMAAAWPLLKDLDLVSISSFVVLPKIAQLLPKLSRLALLIKCRSPPDLDKIPVLTHRLSDLRLLGFDGMSAENPVALARCIDMLFPNLANLTILPSSGNQKWHEVVTIFKALQSSRKDQETRFFAVMRGGKTSIKRHVACQT